MKNTDGGSASDQNYTIGSQPLHHMTKKWKPTWTSWYSSWIPLLLQITLQKLSFTNLHVHFIMYEKPWTLLCFHFWFFFSSTYTIRMKLPWYIMINPMISPYSDVQPIVLFERVFIQPNWIVYSIRGVNFHRPVKWSSVNLFFFLGTCPVNLLDHYELCGVPLLFIAITHSDLIGNYTIRIELDGFDPRNYTAAKSAVCRGNYTYFMW